MRQFFRRALLSLLVSSAMLAACPAGGGGPATEAPPAPLVLAHYMPWFRGPSNISQEALEETYGYHWRDINGVPWESTDGRANVGHFQYPLTGPYHSSNPELLDYQVSLFIIAGIDGVIFDWYGAYEANDFGENNDYTIAMANKLMAAGLKFCVMYEDNTMNMMQMQTNRTEAFRRGRVSFDWLEGDWFKQPLYVKNGSAPLVFCFGPQYFSSNSDWNRLFEDLAVRPFFVDLDHKVGFANSSFPWPPMGRRVPANDPQGVVPLSSIQQYMEGFLNVENSRNKNRTPYRISSVFSAFHSPSYGKILYNDGEALRYTWDAAIEYDPRIIQLVTWNDFGEGSCFEPSRERGYRDLEFVQEQVKAGWKPGLPWTAEDLRWPLEFYKLRYTMTATDEQEAAIVAATQALIDGDAELFREKAAETGATVDVNDLKPLERL